MIFTIEILMLIKNNVMTSWYLLLIMYTVRFIQSLTSLDCPWLITILMFNGRTLFRHTLTCPENIFYNSILIVVIYMMIPLYKHIYLLGNSYMHTIKST